MNLESLEQKLARYEPSGLPPGLKEELIDTVLARVRRRRNLTLMTALAAAMFLASVIVSVKADRVYVEAVRIAGWNSQLPSRQGVVKASVLTTQMPGARTLLQWNGGYYE